MKNRSITLFAFFLVIVMAVAQVSIFASTEITLSIHPDSSSVTMGDEVLFTIRSSDMSGMNFCAFAFKIELSEGLIYKNGSGALVSSFRTSTKMATVTFDETPFLMVSGFGEASYNGGALDIATFTCIASESGSFTVGLTEVELLNVSVKPIPTVVTQAVVTVTNKANSNADGTNTPADADDSNTQSDQTTNNGADESKTSGSSGGSSMSKSPSTVSGNGVAETTVIDDDPSATIDESFGNNNGTKPSMAQPQWMNPFDDVTTADWFYKSVAWTHSRGVMAGVSQTAFSPNSPMTRAMFAQLLYNYSDSPDTGEEANPFTDVFLEAWYYKAVVCAAAENIISGYGNGLFGPEDNITREQIMTLFYNYANMKGIDMNASADLSGFDDVNDISDWALPAVRFMVAKEIVRGRTPAQIAPKGSATRSEVATLIRLFSENLKISGGF